MATLDYLNQNSLRNYPIRDGLGRVSVDGLFTIPNTLIVDLTLSGSGVGSNRMYISKLVSSTTQLVIEVAVVGGATFGSFNTTLPTTEENFDVELVADSNYPDALGLLTIGKTDDLAALPSGSFAFDSSMTEVLTHCIAVGNSGVSRIAFVDAQGNKYTSTGHVTLIANSNLQFKQDGSHILLNAGENLGLNKLCSDYLSSPVLTINGVGPDSAGNFSVLSASDSCITIDQIQYGILLQNSCARPCLGSSAVDTLTSRVNTLESDIFNIRDYVNNLNNVIIQAQTLVNTPCQCDP